MAGCHSSRNRQSHYTAVVVTDRGSTWLAALVVENGKVTAGLVTAEVVTGKGDIRLAATVVLYIRGILETSLFPIEKHICAHT